MHTISRCTFFSNFHYGSKRGAFREVSLYFENVDDDLYFLEELHDVILDSPLFTDDWYGLDRVWYKRYYSQLVIQFKKKVSCSFKKKGRAPLSCYYMVMKEG